MDPTLEAALEAAQVKIFVAVEMVLADGTLRILDGPGSLTFDAMTFLGGGDDGVLTAVEPFTDGVGSEAPSARLTFAPPTNAASVSLCAAANQGGAVTAWLGAINTVTHAVIGDPFLLFAGEWDQGTLTVGQGERQVTIEAVSAWERFFEDDEGVRLNDTFHQTCWPGELGLQFTYDTKRSMPWGRNEAKPELLNQTRGATTSPLQFAIGPFEFMFR